MVLIDPVSALQLLMLLEPQRSDLRPGTRSVVLLGRAVIIVAPDLDNISRHIICFNLYYQAITFYYKLVRMLRHRETN